MLTDGGIVFDGRPMEATSRYFRESLNVAESGSSLLDCAREGNGKARFSAISIQPRDRSGRAWKSPIPAVTSKSSFEMECRSDFANANAAIIFYDMNGYRVIDANTGQKNEYVSMAAGQKARARFLLHDSGAQAWKIFRGALAWKTLYGNHRPH